MEGMLFTILGPQKRKIDYTKRRLQQGPLRHWGVIRVGVGVTTQGGVWRGRNTILPYYCWALTLLADDWMVDNTEGITMLVAIFNTQRD